MADRLAEDGGDDPVRRLFQQLAGEAAADAEAHIGELVDPKVVHQSQLVFGEAAPRVVDGKRASALALVGIALIHGDAAEVRLGFERVDHGIRPIVEPGVQSAARRHEQGEAAAGLFVTDADVASFVKQHGNLLDMRQSNFLRYREDKSRTRAWSPRFQFSRMGVGARYAASLSAGQASRKNTVKSLAPAWWGFW